MAELIDLVNAEGQIVVENFDRDTATLPSNTYMQIAIAVLFNSTGQVLVHERSEAKKVAPKAVDHVCGGIKAGETPEAAALREAAEEVGVIPVNLRVIKQGINEYGCYRHLLVGQASEEPRTDLDPAEVAWAAYHHVKDLAAAHKLNTMQFVDGFFEDIAHAQAFASER